MIKSPEDCFVLYVVFSVGLYIFAALDLPGSALAAFGWFGFLVVQSRREVLKFWHGFFWGLVVFAFHLSWILVLFLKYKVGFSGIIVWLLAVVWFSCASGL